MVRETVEETLNRLLDAEADAQCNAKRYEHTDTRQVTRAGYYERIVSRICFRKSFLYEKK